jgi:hypothetical protein
MALQFTLPAEQSGPRVGSSVAYARITGGYFDKDRLTFDVVIHANADARNSAADALRVLRYEVPHTVITGETLPSLYGYLKDEIPLFDGATDV